MKKFDIVQSHYRARWYGIVINVEKRNNHNDLITVLITHDRCGHKQRKQKKTKLDAGWLKVVGQWIFGEDKPYKPEELGLND